MPTSKQCLEKYGEPRSDGAWLTLYEVPKDLQVGAIPKRIFCNKDLVPLLEKALTNLVSRGYAESELKTWDGCFNIRKKTASSNWSLHSWGLAIDVNAKTNAYGAEGDMTPGFVQCFKDAGFRWGGDWFVRDCMHHEIAHI